MHKRFIYIIIMMVLAFLMFTFSIEYAKRHPITDADIEAKIGKNVDVR